MIAHTGFGGIRMRFDNRVLAYGSTLVVLSFGYVLAYPVLFAAFGDRSTPTSTLGPQWTAYRPVHFLVDHSRTFSDAFFKWSELFDVDEEFRWASEVRQEFRFNRMMVREYLRADEGNEPSSQPWETMSFGAEFGVPWWDLGEESWPPDDSLFEDYGEPAESH